MLMLKNAKRPMRKKPRKKEPMPLKAPKRHPGL